MHVSSVPLLSLMMSCCYESFYGSPPQLLFNEIAGFETSSQPYLLKFHAPCHRDVIVRLSFAKKKMREGVLFMEHPSSCRAATKRSLEKNSVFGEGYRGISPVNKYIPGIYISWCLHESSRGVRFRPGFEPSSRQLELTSRRGDCWTCLALLAFPHLGRSALGRSLFVSWRPLPKSRI